MQRWPYAKHAMAFLILLSLHYAANFNMIWSPGETPPPTYLASDLQSSPSISTSSLVCTGSTAEINFTSTAKWNTISIDGGTASGANSNSESQLLTAPGVTYNFDPKWATSSQITLLHDYTNPDVGSTLRYWRWRTTNNVNDWNPFLSGIGILSYP